MKRARHYTETIRKALQNWTEWTENGAAILAEKGWFDFITLIRQEISELRKLDANDVLDELLEHEDGIGMRLTRLEKYMGIGWVDGKFVVGIPQYIIDSKNNNINLSDDALNFRINECRQLIEEKALDLIRVIKECEEYIKPKHPTIIKALADPLLCSYFYDNKKVLEDYINYCLSDTNKTQKAIKAGELANDNKLKHSCKLKPLHDALEKIGIDVGSYPNWQQAISKI